MAGCRVTDVSLLKEPSSNIHGGGDPKRRCTESEPKLCPPRDFSRYYSCATRKREGSNVKQFYKYFAIPGIHNLAGGKRILQ